MAYNAGQEERAMSNQISLPLFPLNTVLFPGQVLPLHIFEPRYRAMINQCIDKSWPFGVVLIREGEEVGAAARPHEVGTTARVAQVERLDDGRLNIVSVGEMRFRIHTLDVAPDGYLRAEVTLWPWSPSGDPAADARVDRVRDRLRRYVALLSDAAGAPLEMNDLPDEATELACLTAAALQVDQLEKQDLLISASIVELLDKEVGLLRREVRMLQVMLKSRGRPQSDEVVIFSAN
jgi:Lon protease-like protein